MTPVLGRLIVPEVVIMPPASPVPAATEVTVPVPVFEMVMFPAFDERLTPNPAVRLRTPELVTVTLPVLLLTLMPTPAKTPVTAPPPPMEVRVAVAGLTLSPAPTISG
jgi:hypothetical protein